MATTSNNAGTTGAYQAQVRAQQEVLATLRPERRAKLASRARDRSARRWADETAKADQQRRAGKLRLVTGGAPLEPLDQAS